MDHTTSINIFLVVIVVLFIGGLVLIGRRSGATNKTVNKPSEDTQRRPF